MRVFEALNRIADKVDAGNQGTFTLFISDEEKFTIAIDNKCDWEAGQALVSALVSDYEVSRLEWHGIDRITGLADNLYYDETAEEWHSL